MRAPVPSDMSKRNLSASEYKQEANVLAVPGSLCSSCEPRDDASEVLSLSPLLISHHRRSYDHRVSFNLLNHITGEAILFEL